NDKNVLYIAVNNSLYRSANTGNSFELLNSFTTNITGIEVNNNNSEIVYITTSGTSGRVFEGDLSSGALVTNDITGSLPNIPKLVIKHQARHTDNPLYVGTGIGVWRYDNQIGDWEPFENGLPNVPVRDLEVGIEDGKLTAATFGRGVWQTDIPTQDIISDLEIASLEIVNELVINCSSFESIVSVSNNGVNTISSFDINYAAGEESNTVNWSGSLAPGNTVEINLPALNLEAGEYDLNTELIDSTDQIYSNNLFTIPINVNSIGIPEIVEDFESDDSNLLITNLEDITHLCANPNTRTWEKGEPNGTILNGTTSGTNAYATNLSGDYPNNTLEYLVTKCYDLPAVNNPFISFQMAFEIQDNWDVLYMEYSIDGGENWV
ncbi:MAG: glycosyl hydrolase, partial [Bacteroidota bacterium]